MICSTWCKHNPVVSSFMTYHQVCNQSDTMGSTNGTGAAYLSGTHEFTLPIFSQVHVTRSSFLCNALQIFVCPFSFSHYVVCSSSNFGFLLPLCCLQTLLNEIHCITKQLFFDPFEVKYRSIYQQTNHSFVYVKCVYSTYAMPVVQCQMYSND